MGSKSTATADFGQFSPNCVQLKIVIQTVLFIIIQVAFLSFKQKYFVRFGNLTLHFKLNKIIRI